MYFDEILNFKDMHEKLRKDRMKKIGGSLTFIVGLLAVLSFLNTGSNNITGFAFSSLAAPVNIVPFVLFTAIITAVLVTFYRQNISVKTYDLKNVNKPMKISSKSRLRAKFRNKIHKWLSHN